MGEIDKYRRNNYMKFTKTYLLIFSTFFLCSIPTMSRDLPHTQQDLLINNNVQLTGLHRLSLKIFHHHHSPDSAKLSVPPLENKVRSKLKNAGFQLVELLHPDSKPELQKIPELRVYIHTVKSSDFPVSTFSIRTSLAGRVFLPGNKGLHTKADLWQVGPHMNTVKTPKMAEEITQTLLDQIETFVSFCRIANSNKSDDADSGEVAKELLPPPVKSAGSFEYVASKNSRVFHRKTCSFAQTIKEQNLARYQTRQQAIKDGKRPCKVCKP